MIKILFMLPNNTVPNITKSEVINIRLIRDTLKPNKTCIIRNLLIFPKMKIKTFNY